MSFLGPLGAIAAAASEWRTRPTRGGMSCAAVLATQQRGDVLGLVKQHARLLTTDAARRMARAGLLPGLRDLEHVIAVYSEETPPEHGDSLRDADAETQPLELEAGVPIFDHGQFAQANLSDVRHAVHLVRHLNDYHEPTLAAVRRQALQKLDDPDDAEQRRRASAAAAEQFLATSLRWRDVVERAVYVDTIRDIDVALGRRLRGPRGTRDEWTALVQRGLGALEQAQMHATAHEIRERTTQRMAHLDNARVVLVYEEHQYLALLGTQGGHSIRRHLPRGLHLVFSDQNHRRADRTAGLWLASSSEHEQVGKYHYASETPPTYAAKKQRAAFRLADAAAVYRYSDQL